MRTPYVALALAMSSCALLEAPPGTTTTTNTGGTSATPTAGAGGGGTTGQGVGGATAGSGGQIVAGGGGFSGSAGSAGSGGATTVVSDDYVGDVMITVHDDVNTILVVTWTQLLAADNVWLEFTFEDGNVMTSMRRSTTGGV